MQDPAQFPVILCRGVLAVTTLYRGLGALSYLKFLSPPTVRAPSETSLAAAPSTTYKTENRVKES